MKKIMTTILALGLATTLVGCNKSETKEVADVADSYRHREIQRG